MNRPIDIAGLEDELQRKIDDFSDHDWGDHDPRPFVIWHALSVASGLFAIEAIKARAAQ